MEDIAAEALGTEVEIVGDIAFTLLPQPRITFSDVIIGPAETPVAMIGGVEAEFSLLDFLRDRYKVTKLVLEQPRLELRIDESGALQTGIWLAEEVSTSNVSIENAEIAGGMVRLTDARTAEVYDLSQIGGELELSAVRGPFAFTGNGVANRQSYSLRISTSARRHGWDGASLGVRAADERGVLGDRRGDAEHRWGAEVRGRGRVPAGAGDGGAGGQCGR